MVLCQKVGHANADLQPSKPLEHYKDGEPYTPKGVRTVRGGGHAIPVGSTVPTLREDGIQHQLAVFHAYHHFVLPHASLRQPLRIPEATNGTGSSKVWQPCTPAMAAGLTDHVWSLKEVLLYRVPPWPQPAGA